MKPVQVAENRLLFIKFILIFCFIILISRLFYWQVLNSDSLAASAFKQRNSVVTVEGDRGSILASDGFALAANQPTYLLFAYKPQLNITLESIASQLAPILVDPAPRSATQAAIPLLSRIQTQQSQLITDLSDPNKKWLPLFKNLSTSQKVQIENLSILGLGFDEYSTRFYPEASMSAHLLGFVGHDDHGLRKGYFGVEGYYDQELTGKTGKMYQQTDASGRPIIIGAFNRTPARSGRTLKLHLDRSVQHLVEDHLSQALEKYSAISGEVIVMDPFTGGIIAMAGLPAYEPEFFTEYEPAFHKNPTIANSYEPGSTFKVLVMAAALDQNVITPQTKCDSTCDGPVSIGRYTIRTWNNKYYPGTSMTDVLAHSDNTGMIYVANKLGPDKFVDAITRFGIGSATDIDLQEEAVPPLKQKWGDIDLATASFGQGIAVTGIQMVKAVSAIANGGELIKPQVVAEVITHEQTLPRLPQKLGRVISTQAAKQVTEMMVTAAHQGEARWTVLKEYNVAGKTGTAQIPIAGHYDQEKTIASFIGFAPAYHPKFVMLVKLREAQSSPWAAETAAPLWYTIAKDILHYYSVPPEK